MERSFTTMRFFDYEAFLDLVEKLKASDAPEASDDLDALNAALTDFRDYVNTVNSGEQQVRLAAFRFEGEDYRQAVMTDDRQRRAAHNAAVANASLVNNLSKLYGGKPLYTGDLTERLQIADFCLDVTTELFNHRKL